MLKRRLNEIEAWMQPVMLVALLFLCLSASQVAFAQVWRLDFANTDSNQIASVKATLDIQLLELLSVGDEFDVSVDNSTHYRIRIDNKSVLENGDRSWFGSIINTGLDYSLVITVGTNTAHLILTSPSGIFQLYGVSNNDQLFKGNFNRLEHVRDDVTDSEITLPVSGQDVVTSDPFVISQTVSQNKALAGTTLTFNLQFSNYGSTKLISQYVDIFFVLENTTLKQLPTGCEKLQSTENQPVLSCALGDFASKETKRLSYTVTTSLNSHPEVLSAARVGENINFVAVDIFRDVTTDSDGDGISDYNEALSDSDPLIPNADLTAYIDVLVAYTPDINDIYLYETRTRINQLFNVANKIFADSRTGIVLRPVGIHEVDYQPDENLMTDLSVLTMQDDVAFNDLSTLRKRYGGDLVVLFRSGEANGLCGLANLGGKGTEGDFSASYHKDFAFSVINIDCHDDSVLAHEIGHNLGLVHSRIEDADGGTLQSSAGFGEPTYFVTVMAFPDDFKVVNRLYRFSDPTRACGQFLCGEEAQDPVNGADAVSSLKLVKHQVANYFSSQESRIGSINTQSNKNGAVDAIVGIGAYAANGAAFSTGFTVNEAVNLRMKITPLAQHIGKQFITHLVVLDEKQHLYQATSTGALVPWNGALKSLEMVNSPQVMTERALFDVVKDIDLGAVGLLDRTVSVFVAYRMVDTGELVYGKKPFSFRISTSNPE